VAGGTRGLCATRGRGTGSEAGGGATSAVLGLGSAALGDPDGDAAGEAEAATGDGVKGPKSGGADATGTAATVALGGTRCVNHHQLVAAPEANITTARNRIRMGRDEPDSDGRDTGEVLLMVSLSGANARPPGRSG
jgi:hypothetical protein